MKPFFVDHEKFLKEIHPLHRTLVHQDMDVALKCIEKYCPGGLSFKEHLFSSGEDCWTWKIPQEFVLKKAQVSNSKGEIVLDALEHPLHIVSYSKPVNQNMSFEELIKYIHTNPKRPNDIPWVFDYYGDKWGFCMSHNKFLSLDKKDIFNVVIESEFPSGFLRVGEIKLKGKLKEEIVIVSDYCHPCQVNDSISGVSLALELLHRFVDVDLHYSLTFIFVPETIGSVAYLSQREKTIANIKYAIFSDSIGSSGNLKIQSSRTGDALIDLAIDNLKSETVEIHPFRSVVGNDELIFNGPSVNVPTISLVRHPFPEYHTSADIPGVIMIEKIIEAVNIVELIIVNLSLNMYPLQKYKGVLSLSRYNLFVSKQDDFLLNKAMEKLLMMLDGQKSTLEIAYELNLKFNVAHDFLMKLKEKDLIEVFSEPYKVGKDD